MLHEEEILRLTAGGENSYVEFKEDTVDNKKLAKDADSFFICITSNPL